MEATATKVTFQKYPAYKDSGSDWSGQIPVDWESLPIRAIFEERNEKNDGPKTDFILSVTKDRGVIPYDEKGQIGNNKSEDIERYKVVYPNDFVINKMNVIIGSLGMSKYFGAFSQVYLVYKPKSSRINIEYYSYIFSNPSFYKSLIRFCTGIMELRESLNKNDFKKIILPFPDFNTQTAIVRFLNDKTAKIDRAIAQKEKMISLLKERKQIIIQNAVTKGFDPNAKMKDSGVEWIGEIPEGWEVKKVKHISLKISKGTTPSTEGRSILDEGKIRFIKAENIQDGLITDYPEHFIDEKTNEIIGRSKLQENDILFVIAGATLGKVAIVSKNNLPANTNQAVSFIRPLKRANPLYISIWLTSSLIKEIIWLQAVQSAQPNLSMEDLGNLPFLSPSENEQTAIVTHIETQSDKIDKAIKLQEQQIEKLKELKSTLIDSAVTGKIKVS